VEKVAKAASRHCILESWLVLSSLCVALSQSPPQSNGDQPAIVPLKPQELSVELGQQWLAAGLLEKRGTVFEEARQQLLKFLKRPGPTEQESLEQMAIQAGEELALFFGFHALGDNR
jgi:hypothetical protein